MKTVEIDNFTDDYKNLISSAQNENILLTKHGEPFLSISNVSGMDIESVSLSMNERFIGLIENARQDIRLGRRKSVEEIAQRFHTK